MPEFYEPTGKRTTTLPDEPYYQVPTVPAPRRSGGRTLVGAVLLVLGVVWLVGALLGGASERSGPIESGNTLFDQTYVAGRLVMDVSTGDIQIRSWDGSEIKVEAIYQGGSIDDYAVTVEPRDGTLYVSGGPKPGLLNFGERELEYRISVPTSADIQIKTLNGDVDVAELQGIADIASTNGEIIASAMGNGLRAETVNGRIELDDISGAIDLHSTNGEITLSDGQATSGEIKNTNGDIELRGVSGTLTVETVNGSIEIGDASDAKLRASTSNGNIEFEGSLASTGTNVMSTVSGNVVMRLPEDSNFTLDAETISGEIETDFELQDRQESRRNLRGNAGSGGSRLEIKTISGDISIN